MKITLTEREMIHGQSAMTIITKAAGEKINTNTLANKLLSAPIGHTEKLSNVSRVKKIITRYGNVEYIFYINENAVVDLSYTIAEILKPFMVLINPIKDAIQRAVDISKDFERRYK